MLSAGVRERIRAEFPPEQHGEAEVALAAYGEGQPDAERVHHAILNLAAGDLEELRQSVRTAEQDYRDVLFYGEYSQAERDAADERMARFIEDFKAARTPRQRFLLKLRYGPWPWSRLWRR